MTPVVNYFHQHLYYISSLHSHISVQSQEKADPQQAAQQQVPKYNDINANVFIQSESITHTAGNELWGTEALQRTQQLKLTELLE